MKILLIGRLVISTKLIIVLKKTGLNFTTISTETEPISKKIVSNPIFETSNYLGRFYAFLSIPFAKYTRFLFSIPFLTNLLPKSFLEKLTSLFSTEKPDVIIGNWGVGILPEINLLKSLFKLRQTPVILNMETFPTGWDSKVREYLELVFLRLSLKNIEGLIIPTNEMYELLLSKGISLDKKIIYKRPFYFPMSYFERSAPEDQQAKYDLIFLGKPDLFRSLNTVQDQLIEIANSGVSIGCSELFQVNHENIHTFKPFNIYDSDFDFLSLSKLYKAALITFNIDNKKPQPPRFETSLPHRFLLPLALKLPVVVPKNGFNGMGKIIEEYKIGFRYDSVQKLKKYLYSIQVEESKSNIYKNKKDLDFNIDSFKEYLEKF
tara:strand:- start:20758 stop:21888 length:1131 start_codon:yes stop_codon:yes gene_type:complete